MIQLPLFGALPIVQPSPELVARDYPPARRAAPPDVWVDEYTGERSCSWCGVRPGHDYGRDPTWRLMSDGRPVDLRGPQHPERRCCLCQIAPTGWTPGVRP